MWEQLRYPDVSIEYKGGWCLKAVRESFGFINEKYETAMSDWQTGNKHYDNPPAGVAVPVYFNLTKVPAGHVAIKLANGTVASSSRGGVHKGLTIHPNMADLIRVYTRPENGICTFIGWSEEVNDTPVVRFIEGGVKEMDTRQAVRDLYMEVTGKYPKKDIEDQKVGYIDGGGSFKQLLHDVLEFSVNYRSLPRLVDDVYMAGGYDPGKQVKQDKVGALAGGFPYSTLIKEVIPSGSPTPIDPKLKEKADKYDQVMEAYSQFKKLMG